MQMKEMNSEKEVGCISRNQKWKKAQKMKKGSDNRQKKKNKKGSTQTMDGEECKLCGRIHKPRECPAFGQKCHKCKKKNHWASCCMTKKVQKASTKSDDGFVIETVEEVLKEKSTEALVILKINNKKVKVKLDTGTGNNVTPTRVFKQVEDSHIKMERTKTKLCEYGLTNIPVEGKVMCEFRDAKQKSEFYATKTDSKTVLSLQTCRKLGMIQILNEVTSKEDNKKEKDGTSMERAGIEKKDEMITEKSGKELKQTIMKMYPNIFKGLGKVEPEHYIKLKEDISPKVHQPRKKAASLREKIKEELTT